MNCYFKLLRNIMFRILIVYAISIYFVSPIKGHGMMVSPIGRASRWRVNNTAPINWDDNQLFCGGYSVQWHLNDGKCGLCGDDYTIPIPRPHEYGGLYGEGVVVKMYKTGGKLPVTVNLTSNHWGDFTWDLCRMDVNKKESEECFNKIKLKLIDGSEKYTLKSGKDTIYKTTLQIPNNLECKHCVLRWTYRTANSWGRCEDGTGAVGCGPQEYFRSCSDISIKI